MLNMVLRSEIHATDSTFIGMERKQRRHHEAASYIIGRLQEDPEQQDRVQHVKQAFTSCGPPGVTPKSWQSSAWHIHVSGCQLAAKVLVQAHLRVLKVRPA